LFKKGLVGDAIAELQEALRLEPKDTDLQYTLGMAKHINGQIEEAIAAYRESVRLSPKFAAGHKNLGAALAETGQTDDALAHFQIAVKLDPKDIANFMNLCSTLQDMGLFEEAIATLREAMKSFPDNPAALNALAWSLAVSNKTNQQGLHEAVTLAQQAVELEPTSGAWWNTLGVAQYRVEDYHSAIKALLKSTELGLQGPSNFFFLAMTEWQLGNQDEARRWYNKGSEWMTQHPQVVGGEIAMIRAETKELLGILGMESSADSSQSVN
jgi:Flp pilus assembly protein TadD